MAARFNKSFDAPWKLSELYTFACLSVASTFDVPLVLYGSTALNLYMASMEHEVVPADIDLFMVLDSATEFSTALTRFRRAVDTVLAELCAPSRVPPHLVMVMSSSRDDSLQTPCTVKMFMNDAVAPASPTTHIGDITLQVRASVSNLVRAFPRQKALLCSKYAAPGVRAHVHVASFDELLHRMSTTIVGGTTLDGIECTTTANSWRIEKDAARLDRTMDLLAAKQVTREPKPLVLRERGVARAYTCRTTIQQTRIGDVDNVWMPIMTPSPLPTTACSTQALRDIHAQLIELRAQVCALRAQALRHIEQGSSIATASASHVSTVRKRCYF